MVAGFDALVMECPTTFLLTWELGFPTIQKFGDLELNLSRLLGRRGMRGAAPRTSHAPSAKEGELPNVRQQGLTQLSTERSISLISLLGKLPGHMDLPTWCAEKKCMIPGSRFQFDCRWSTNQQSSSPFQRNGTIPWPLAVLLVRIGQARMVQGLVALVQGLLAFLGVLHCLADICSKLVL